jgi:predicted esterase
MRSFIWRIGVSSFAFLPLRGAGALHTRHSTRAAAITVCEMSNGDSSSYMQPIRVLVLHGSEGTAKEFPSRLETLVATLKEEHDVQLDITSIQGPFPKGQGYSWWTMPPGVRSSTATEYEGFDTSSAVVLEAWKTNDPPFDLILGHSQGAIMISALLALGQAPYHPSKGYILNGVAVPNPYTSQLESLKLSEEERIPRILFLMGVKDRINPNETGEQLRDALENAGMSVDTISHPGGHGVPQEKDDTMKDIVRWIVQDSK